jgi:hypothetical protein
VPHPYIACGAGVIVRSTRELFPFRFTSTRNLGNHYRQGASIMTLIRTVTILICLSALFSYLNQRWIKLPFTIGMTAIALTISLLLVLLGKFGFGIEREAEAFIDGIDFNVTVMHDF